MKIRRILALTKKELKRTIREPAVLFMIFLFPIVFVVAFGASFGGFGGGSTVTYQIGVVNYDTGAHSQTFLNDLTSTKIVNLSVYADNSTAQNDLSQGKMQALILIPDGFSGSVNSYNTAPANAAQWTNTTVQLYLDKGSLVATHAVPPIIQQTVNAMLNQQSLQSPIQLSTASLVEVKQFSALDFIAPGMFTFASIFLIMMVAQSFTGDRENGMMKRIRISPITPSEFMSSLVLSYLAIALIQAALLFGITYAMGFRPAVDGAAYLFTFTIVLIFSVSNIGFGLITATIAKAPVQPQA
jgi:ABC-2 type transport system permease protein